MERVYYNIDNNNNQSNRHQTEHSYSEQLKIHKLSEQRKKQQQEVRGGRTMEMLCYLAMC